MFWNVYSVKEVCEWKCSICHESLSSGLWFVPTYVGEDQAKWIKRMWDEEPECFTVCENCIGERPWIRGKWSPFFADGANEWLIDQIDKEFEALRQEAAEECRSSD